MTVDYDLVVIGSSLAGIYAAKRAVQLQARVALVTQSDRLFLPNDTLFNCSLSTVGQFRSLLKNNSFIATDHNFSSFSLAKSRDWIEETNIAVQNLNSLSYLAALGVDVIAGKGEFYRLPSLRLRVKKRELKSRNFLLATGSNFAPDFVDSDVLKCYLTLRDLDSYKLGSLPKNIIIIGGEPISIELAQALSFFDKEITLIVKEKSILPQEDKDIRALMMAQLEANGINIYTDADVSQIKAIDNKKWLQVGDIALSADEIIIADYRKPNIAGLNLAGIDIKYDNQRIYVNKKLQTSNPNIYACGDLIGGYSLPNIAQYEAQIIIKNALFFPWYKTNYHTVPWAITTQLSLARVGLNEKQARQKYQKIYVIRQYFNNIAQGKIFDNNPGIFKLLISNQGEILGCSIFGDRATELITIPALMMQHKIKLDRNPMRGLTSVSIPHVYPSAAEIIDNAIADFYQQKIQENPQLLNRIRTWFSLRKN